MDKYNIIKKYINEFDYYELLATGAPSDEFDSYSREFAEKIQQEHSVEEIATIIANRMDTAFGNEVDINKSIDIAGKIKVDLNN